ncbi:hypothetical protein [Edaphobacter bradus]|uniref:hypothetical protein n=1 Tax=Edaphobacter bradus TaxID=2259016 RepID=UPI00295B61FC|nr:hypothetical protein [Edaphobacter bradus]
MSLFSGWSEGRCNNAGMGEQYGVVDRRRFLGVCSALGLGQTLMPGVLWGMAAQAPAASSSGEKAKELGKITPEMIDAAAVIAGIKLKDEQKSMMLEGLGKQRDSVIAIRSMKLANSVAPAFVFDPDEARYRAEADADECGSGCFAVERWRGSAGVCLGAGACGAGEDTQGDERCAHEDVPGAVEAARSASALCDYADRGAGAEAGGRRG